MTRESRESLKTVAPGDDEYWLRQAVIYYGKNDEERAETCAMLAGVNAASLGIHDLPPILAQNAPLRDEWHWGHNIGLKGISERQGKPQGQLL